jgi:hypothetical protein
MRDNDRGVVGLRVSGPTAAAVVANARFFSRELLLIGYEPVKEVCQGEAVPPSLTDAEAS